MSAPLAETAGPGPLVGLGLASLRAYPAFVAELREETGVDLEIAGPGLLRLAASQAEQAELRAAYDAQQDLGLPLEWLAPDAIRRLEPRLAPGFSAGGLSPAEKHVDPCAWRGRWWPPLPGATDASSRRSPWSVRKARERSAGGAHRDGRIPMPRGGDCRRRLERRPGATSPG